MTLPDLPVKVNTKSMQFYTLQGINRSDNNNEGTLYDCKNITSRRYPYHTTKYQKSIQIPYENATAITAWDSLLVVDGTDLYYDGVPIKKANGDNEVVLEGAKQFAVINTKIVIMPDKKYLDLPTKRLVDMVWNQDVTATIQENTPNTSDTTQTLTITGYASHLSDFDEYKYDEESGESAPYVVVTLSKTVNDEVVTKKYNLFFVKAEASGSNLVLTFRHDAESFSGETYTSMNMKNNIPDFDYICSSDNRIWGCVSETQTLIASELGVPTRFYTLSDKSTDSWQVAVPTAGDFTGCCSLGSSILFFKENCIHKVLGSTPSAYSMYSYDMDGVKKGCYKSLVVLNDTIYYVSNRGVMTYSGGSVRKISDDLGDTELNNAVAGTDGDKYYVYCYESSRHSLFTLDFKTGVWLREEDRQVLDFARLNDKLYMIIYENIDGKEYRRVWFNTTLPLDDDWYIEFNNMYESTYNNYGRRTSTVLGKKSYSKLILRVEMAKTSYARIMVRCDEGRWVDVGKIVGKEGVFTHTVPINRCDKFAIRIEGHGEFTLLAMSREFRVGSVRHE